MACNITVILLIMMITFIILLLVCHDNDHRFIAQVDDAMLAALGDSSVHAPFSELDRTPYVLYGLND